MRTMPGWPVLAAAFLAPVSTASWGPVPPATFTVINTNNSGAGSLRQAILNANATAGTDLIDFDIPGAGPHTIQPTSPLPTITDPVVIDGYTQAGAGPNTNGPGLGSNAVLMIELDGINAVDVLEVAGLLITGGSSTVRGLVINRFERGVELRGSSATGNVVEGNFLGTDVTGTTALGNLIHGVLIRGGASNNTIGGATAGARNLISGSPQFGLGISGSGTTGNVVEGNFIGTDVTGTVGLGNLSFGVPINFQASNNTIGGTTAEARNIISDNGTSGVQIASSATGNVVEGNFIGTDVTGTADLGNSGDGVAISDLASGNIIGGTASGAGNTIAFNSEDGVTIDIFGATSTRNAVLGNSIFSNKGLGIDLRHDGVTANDPGDVDTGANDLQNFPVLTFALTGGGIVFAEGTLNSTSSTSFRLEFFANSARDPSGHGEGETFVGSTTVTTDSSGNAAFAVMFASGVPAGQFVSATATDPTGNTSEFSKGPMIVIDGCDTDVENRLVDTETTISDLIDECAASARNHGQFVRCVADLTIVLRDLGIITGKEKGAIDSCAARANIPG